MRKCVSERSNAYKAQHSGTFEPNSFQILNWIWTPVSIHPQGWQESQKIVFLSAHELYIFKVLMQICFEIPDTYPTLVDMVIEFKISN